MVFTFEKTLKRKGYNLYVMQKDYGSARLKIGFINLTYLKKMSQLFPKPQGSYNKNVNVKLDLSNHVTKSEVKAAAGYDKTFFAKKTD